MFHGERLLDSSDQPPVERFTSAIDRLVSRGDSIDWLPKLRPSDECTAFTPVFADITDEWTLRRFLGHQSSTAASSVGFAIRPRSGTEGFAGQSRGAISDYAVLLAVFHTDSTVTEMLFHHHGGRVRAREHLRAAPSPSQAGSVDRLTPAPHELLAGIVERAGDIAVDIDSRFRLGLIGGDELLLDYNYDSPTSEIVSYYGIEIGDDFTDQLVRLLDDSQIPTAT